MKTRGIWQTGLALAMAAALTLMAVGAAGAVPADGPQISGTSTNAETVRVLYALFTAGDARGITAHLAPNVEVIQQGPEQVAYAGTHRGIQGFQDYLGKLDATLEFSQLEVRELISEGDRVVALGHAAGEARATGQPFEGDFVHVWTFNGDGQVVRMQGFEDTFQAAQLAGTLDAGRGLASPMQADANERAARQLFDMSIGVNALDSLIADDFVGYLPGGMAPLRGRQAYIDNMAAIGAAFPDARQTIDDIVSSGDKVVVRWTVSGTNTGPFMGMQPTGKTIHFSGITEMTFRDGKLVEQHEQYDAESMMRQLGLLPDMPSAPAEE